MHGRSSARPPPQASFFHQHGCDAGDANSKYSSRAAQLYRERIKVLASQAARKHGTDVSVALSPAGVRRRRRGGFYPMQEGLLAGFPYEETTCLDLRVGPQPSWHQGRVLL